jgi:hypothetical protein
MTAGEVEMDSFRDKFVLVTVGSSSIVNTLAITTP